MSGFANPGQFFGPAEALAAYKNMECAVGGGTAVVSVNKYRNASHAADKGGCQNALVIKDRLRGVAPDAWERAGGPVSYVDVFSGKGSPWTIASVLETFAVYSDDFIKKYSKGGAPERQCAAILANDTITWEETLQQICDAYIGLDCNGFVGNWLKVVQPDFKLNQNSKSNDVRAKAKAYRAEVEEIEYWDVMCYVANEHIAAVNTTGGAPQSLSVCQSAGGGPRMNEFKFTKTGAKTYRLAAPTPQDIGNDFYVVSLW